MKKMSLVFAVIFCLLLSGCTPAVPPATASLPEYETAQTTVPTSVPTSAPATEPSAESTEASTAEPETQPPEHSPLYIPGVEAEDVILWFNEVCLDGEYINSGDPSVVQKWVEPIVCRVVGTPTEEDLQVLETFADWLNALPGFPGIRITEDPGEVNLRFHFAAAEEMLMIMGENFSGMDGAATFWYSGTNEIYDGQICVRTEIGQYLRNSVILEELYNCLGPMQDTVLRADSIITQEYAEPQKLSQVDELILMLLYHPDILCGMDAGECEAVIRQLYY